jgi:mRNA deadenylase 3'-5' endonuclease subunit Ccr4
VTSYNHISALGTQVDIFVKCNLLAMNWSTRRWRIIEEIIRHDPDIICLQEVDHFKMLSRAFGSIGYRGRYALSP